VAQLQLQRITLAKQLDIGSGNTFPQFNAARSSRTS